MCFNMLLLVRKDWLFPCQINIKKRRQMQTTSSWFGRFMVSYFHCPQGDTFIAFQDKYGSSASQTCLVSINILLMG